MKIKSCLTALLTCSLLFLVNACSSVSNDTVVNKAAISPATKKWNGQLDYNNSVQPIVLNNVRTVYYKCGQTPSDNLIIYYYYTPNQNKAFTNVRVQYKSKKTDFIPFIQGNRNGNIFEKQNFVLRTPPATPQNIHTVEHIQLNFVMDGRQYDLNNCVLDKVNTMKVKKQQDAYINIIEPPANFGRPRSVNRSNHEFNRHSKHGRKKEVRKGNRRHVASSHKKAVRKVARHKRS